MHKYVEKLLNGRKVEWRRLGDVAELRRGRVISKKYLSEQKGIYPVYSSQTVNNGEIGRIDTYDFDGEFVNWTTDGANAGTVFYRNGKFSITNVSGLIKVNENVELNVKFLYYWLSIEAKKHVYSGMGNPKLMSNQMAKILIPIPPLYVQHEIVRVLDNFTELTAELTAELSLRKKQYEYYRDKLLTFGDEVEWKELGDVAEIGTGNSNRKDEDKNGIYPFYVRSKNILRTNNYQFDETAIVIPGEGGIGDIFHYVEGKYALHQRAYKIHILKENIITKFIYYFMNSFFKQYILSKSVGATSISIRKPMLEKFKIPIPPIEKQKEIVEILDKFDTLTNSITEGLPKEIDLRTKQYEYYKDILLDFK